MPARLITLDTGEENYLRILGGPPENETLRSGMVRLKPGESVGLHCTDYYEELVIVLHGQGEASIVGEEALSIERGFALYIPPRTDHDIKNVGTVPLTYVYVVARVPSRSGH
jgi:mannose-6-phosphate isomerase-like protein (cupin superfamily)